jgi:tryptophan-rich sensory protein
MGVRIKPIMGAALTGAVIAYLGTQFIFNPAMPEPAFEPMLPIFASLAVFWIVMSLFFDWAVQKTGKTMLTAMVIALSQILLVDFNYVLLGRRELQPALYSVGIILVLWVAIAVVYDKLSETS